jgi:hypothetical protein
MQRRVPPDTLAEIPPLGLNALMATTLSWQTPDSSSTMEPRSGTADFPSIHQRGRSDSSETIVSRRRINNPYEFFSKKYTKHNQNTPSSNEGSQALREQDPLCRKIGQWFSIAVLRECITRYATCKSYLLFAIEPAGNHTPEAISSWMVHRIRGTAKPSRGSETEPFEPW